MISSLWNKVSQRLNYYATIYYANKVNRMWIPWEFLETREIDKAIYLFDFT